MFLSIMAGRTIGVRALLAGAAMPNTLAAVRWPWPGVRSGLLRARESG